MREVREIIKKSKMIKITHFVWNAPIPNLSITGEK